MKYIGNITRADEATINNLVEIGALYIDDTGIHASAPGIYQKKKAPMTAKSEGALK